MRTRRLAFAALVAAALAVPAVISAAGYCFPGCAIYSKWDIEYYLFQCWECPPNPPEGG